MLLPTPKLPCYITYFSVYKFSYGGNYECCAEVYFNSPTGCQLYVAQLSVTVPKPCYKHNNVNMWIGFVSMQICCNQHKLESMCSSALNKHGQEGKNGEKIQLQPNVYFIYSHIVGCILNKMLCLSGTSK